jgi:hypothetical protein
MDEGRPLGTKAAANEGETIMAIRTHRPLDTDAPHRAFARILDDLWDEELSDYEVCPSPGHRFEQLVAVANWLNGGDGRCPDCYLAAREGGLWAGWRPWPDVTDREPAHSRVEGGTVDVTEAAKKAGFSCPVAVTVDAWNALIAGECGLESGGEAESLDFLLHQVGEVAAATQLDVRTSFYATGGPDRGRRIDVDAIHGRDVGGGLRLTIALAGEVEP